MQVTQLQPDSFQRLFSHELPKPMNIYLYVPDPTEPIQAYGI